MSSEYFLAFKTSFQGTRIRKSKKEKEKKKVKIGSVWHELNWAPGVSFSLHIFLVALQGCSIQ